MANFGRVPSDTPGFLHEKAARPAVLPARSGDQVFGQLWRNPAIHGATVPCNRSRRSGTWYRRRAAYHGKVGFADTPSRSLPAGAPRLRRHAQSAPAVGGLGCLNQHITQFAQFGGPGSLVERCCDILGRTSDLVDAI